MEIKTILDLDRVVCIPDISSKKKTLELLGSTLSDEYQDLSSNDIVACLLDRERLGSTALGEGVALPHGRCEKLEKTSLAIVKLTKGIEFDAPDKQPVDLFIGLIVPDNANDQHLEILAMLAEMMADKTLVTSLRESATSELLYETLLSWKKPASKTDAA